MAAWRCAQRAATRAGLGWLIDDLVAGTLSYADTDDRLSQQAA